MMMMKMKIIGDESESETFQINREKADAEELSGSRRVSDTFLRLSSSSSALFLYHANDY